MNIIKQVINNIASELRYKKINKFIVGSSLDVGAKEHRQIFTKCCDLIHAVKVDEQDIHNLSYKNNQFDTVCSLETLEHTHDPVKAIGEIKRVAKKRIIITVPLEPWFSLPRLSWNKEHLWAVTPAILEHYLGKPIYSKQFLFRWYIGVWDR